MRALPTIATISENPITDSNILMGFKLPVQHTYFIHLFIWLQSKACWILVLRPGIEHVRPAVEVLSCL